MTKRILALFLVCILAIPLLVVPASANSLSEAQWLNLLEYDTVTDSGNFFTYSGTYSVSLTLPAEQNLYYIDAVVQSTKAISVTAVWSSRSTVLTVQKIGNSSLYRVYGALPTGNYRTLRLDFASSGTTYCTLLRCDVTGAATLSYPDMGTLYSSPSSSGTLTMANASSSVTTKLTAYTIDGLTTIGNFTSYIYLNNWKNYDYVDVYFLAYTYTLDSVTAVLDEFAIPFEISYIGDATPGEGDAIGSGENALMYPSVYRSVMVRCDLRGLDRTSTLIPVIRLQGTYYGAVSKITLLGYTGYVVTNNIDSNSYFLRNLWNTVKTGFSNVGTWISNQTATLVSTLNTGFNNIGTWISEQTNALLSLGEGDADDFNNQTATDATEWSEALDEIEKATMPDTDDLDIDLEHQIDGYDAEIGDLIKVFFQNEYIYVVFLLAFTFALISFTVFGKR